MTRYRLKKASKDSIRRGHILAAPIHAKRFCWKLSDTQVMLMFQYFSSAKAIQNVAYGTYQIKNVDGNKTLIAKVIRRQHNADLIRLIQSMLRDCNLPVLSESTLSKMLRLMPAAKCKTMQGVDSSLEAERSNYGYFMEMGCGKSKVLIDNVAWLYEQKKIDTVVIVAPKGVYRNWQVSEIPAHLREDIEHEVYVWNPNPNKDQQRHLKEGIEERKKLRIFLVNVEGFATTKVRKYMDMFVRGSSFLLAVDESTTIKNPKAKRTKALPKIAITRLFVSSSHLSDFVFYFFAQIHRFTKSCLKLNDLIVSLMIK